MRTLSVRLLTLAAFAALACSSPQRNDDDNGTDTNTEAPDAGTGNTGNNGDPDGGTDTTCLLEGDDCSGGGRCCTGFACTDGLCVKKTASCTTSTTCTAGLSAGGCCDALPYCTGSSSTKHCSATCGSDNVRCAANGDCCDGLTCTSGTCKAPVTTCENDACTTGSCCSSAPYCTGAPTGTDLSCSKTCAPSTWFCSADADCCSGLSCLDGTCKSANACSGTACGEGTAGCCSTSPYCGSATGGPLECASRCFAVDDACSGNYDCCSGVCLNGACATSTSGTTHANLGKKCHANGDCADSALECVLYDSSASYGYCTMTCNRDTDCGPGAVCESDGYCYRSCPSSTTCGSGLICDSFQTCMPDCRVTTNFCGSYTCDSATGECQ